MGLASLNTVRGAQECATSGYAWRQQDSSWAMLDDFVDVLQVFFAISLFSYNN